MFEEEAEEYTKQRAKVLGINDLNLAYHAMQRAYQYGAEFGYNKAKEEMQAQIEKMKCGGNCKHLYHINTGGCYDAKCDLTYCDCINCKDKWELRR